MTSSLVGSEMCIRDRDGKCSPNLQSSLVDWGSYGRGWLGDGPGHNPVSYTHLTLPTICSV
eukprot:4209015-Prorocentrum_lima.AAC.1